MIAMKLFLLLISALAVASDEINTPPKSPSYDYYRLPNAVRPQKYVLQVETFLDDPNNLTFAGEVAIRLEILEDSSNITVHVKNLTINTKGIILKGVRRHIRPNCIDSTEVNELHDYFIMHLCEPVRQGEQYILMIPFAGVLNHKLSGYYRSSYRHKETNQTRWLSITQFEPAAARAAFPCFDEPEYKATFVIILGHHKRFNALSNMPMKEEKPMEDREDWMWSEFHESVPMSTYLVAYSINDFVHARAEVNLKGKVQFRTWARSDAIGQCNYAGEVGPKFLEYYENIFDIKFPLAKIDQIAIPDFSAGAMENWGLVTYRETALLYAENVSSIEAKQRVASVIAHELAHQWFGNLVTMKWWTDLWLNEGFATYIASLGVQHVHPEWKLLQQESVENTLIIFKLDALKSSHPISQPIGHTNQIYEIFDSISYKKGSSVLRMMHMFMGDESFRLGIYNYLKKHAYSNAEQNDLWAALTDSAHKLRAIPSTFDIKSIMDSWTLQTGYPIITVKRNYDQKTATVSQMRYLLDVEASRTEDQSCWWVPLSYTSKHQANFDSTLTKHWLECHESDSMTPQTIEDVAEKDEWVIFNIQMAGLFKIKYDEDNWNMLIDTLTSDDFSKIHIINRAQLIDDAMSLAWSGDQNYDIAMRLIEYLKLEREYIPWKAALDNLSQINRILRQTAEYEFFKKYMRQILTPIFIHLNGLNVSSELPEDSEAILHKSLIASWACRFEVEDCVPRARAYFSEWRGEPNPDEVNTVPTNLRRVVYCTAIRHGDDEDWQFLWARYKHSNVAYEKTLIISALGCTREVWLLQRYLDWAFDESSHIRKQDSTYAFSAVAHGEVGFHLARDYFLSNIKFLHDFYDPNSSDLSRLLMPIANQMASRREYDKMKIFVEHNVGLLKRVEHGVRRALETIQINAQWKERNYNEIARRLREYQFAK